MDATHKTNETYERLTQALDHIIELKDQIREQEAALKKERLKNETLFQFINHFLSDFEGSFSAEDEAPSWETADVYVKAAKYCEHHFDRRENDVRHVEEWMMNQIMPAPKTPRDYDYNY